MNSDIWCVKHTLPASVKKPTHKWHIWFLPTHKPTLRKTKRAIFSNALLKIKVDKIWKLEKQYLLLTKFVNRDLRWKQ